jgi:hypothetical protein
MYTSREVLTEAAPVAQPGTTGTEPDSLWLLFVMAHVPLGPLMYSASALAFVHQTIVFTLGFWWALSGQRLERTAVVGAYITGSEVLWRMTNDRLYWEFSKYAVIVLFTVALLKKQGLRSLILPALCFALLLPSVPLTLRDNEHLWRARQEIVFNLAGPLALAISARFFCFVRLTPALMRRLLLALVAPALGVAAVASYAIMTASHIEFTTESNFATSGGFGPNQVSAILGLGGLAALWCLLEREAGWHLRLVLFGAMVWLGTQSALTFSRGGLLAAVMAAMIGLVFTARDRQTRLRLVFAGTMTILMASYVVWPRLVEFTGGKIATRFEETDLSARDRLFEDDLETWRQHQILGVGPGRSRFQHAQVRATHTEFSRLLSEHGLFGATWLLLQGFFVLYNVKRAASNRDRSLTATAMVWSLLFMANSAMRLVAPAFMFGLGFQGTMAGQVEGHERRGASRRLEDSRQGYRVRRAPAPAWRASTLKP